MFVYISEAETFTAFSDDSVLLWRLEDLVYGDWTGGQNGDGSYIKNALLQLSQVTFFDGEKIFLIDKNNKLEPSSFIKG